MVSALETPIKRPTITGLIDSCKLCLQSWRSCKQQQRHGVCIFTKEGRRYGDIGSMERMAAMETEAWCTAEVMMFGGPQ